MPSSKEYLEFVLEQLSDLEDINYRKMMGEYILYYKDKIIGGVYDDRLLIKQTDKAKEMIRDVVYELPYENAKPMLLVDVDDKSFLTNLCIAIYDELPYTKKKNKN